MSTAQHDPIQFEVRINWMEDTRGIITSDAAEGAIQVAMPPEFGGTGKPWSPEHLFLGSLCSCFMTTYLLFVNKFKFSINDLDCSANGKVERVDGRYCFTSISLYPKITIPTEEMREKAVLALEKAHKYCLISASIKSEIIYHNEVITGPKPEWPSKRIHSEAPVHG